ncbi:MAG TPA: phosphoglucosamine mutase [Candidatus Polarisedimenticolaceae bacterium]
MKRLFGTDGIRGEAGVAPLDPATVRRFGAALATVLGGAAAAPRVLLGRDTRESGPWLRDAVAAGLASQGGSAVDAGVITTPGLAFGTSSGRFDAGVMISASHNPFGDNGLKVFGRDGMKLPDAQEAEIERWILDHDLSDAGSGAGRAAEDGAIARRYVAFLEGAVPEGRFRGRRLLLDCANGSASALGAEIFRHHGAEVEAIGDRPDGRNINLGCGSLHLERLAERVRAGGFDLGLGFDGDADRCLAVDRTGRVVDGDHILYLTARKLKRDGLLHGDGVVATIMSNFWLEKRLADEGIRLHRSAVGDKYVLEKMIAEDAALGGEQSGHVIFRDRMTTGDGLLTGLVLLDAILDEQTPLETILDGIVPFPQKLVNVRVASKPDLRSHPVIGPAVAQAESDLHGTGRIVLRYSGTESLARVMVEAEDPAAVERVTAEVADLIRRELGA